MGLLEVIMPGILSSVQDTGRVGYRHAGVPLCGAFDTVALSIGNRLLGNTESDAAIEMTMMGGEYRFGASTVICLTGAHADDTMIVNGDHQDSVAHQQPTVIPMGCTLRVGRFKNGARGYLCVAGGIQSPPVLGSRSALVSLPDAGLGCMLRAGDLLELDELGSIDMTKMGKNIPQESVLNQKGTRVLRIVPGAHYEKFTKFQQAALSEMTFRVSDQSNRAGIRLSENKIPGDRMISVRSEATLPGYVQVPPSGEPIVLGVDGPTTGGYPVLACVIEADLPILGQCGIREHVNFRWVSRENAQKVLQEQQAMIQSYTPLCPVTHSLESPMPVQSYVHLGCDTGEALAGPGRDLEMALLPYVTAVSIACGGHAGDDDSMREAITAASEHGCIIGAHPSYPDREGFGRREIEINRASLETSLVCQLSTFSKIAAECDASVEFIKAHGALYHRITGDTSFAYWYWDICTSIFPEVQFVGPYGAAVLDDFKSSGIPVLAEGFCDRVYESDGTLRARSFAGACINDSELAASQAERLIKDFSCDFLCVHSDTSNVLEIVRLVRELACLPDN